jgi:hypothetical protein
MPRYFIESVCFFWLPSILMYAYVSRLMTRFKLEAFYINFLIWCLITFVFEYTCLSLDIWNFSEKLYPLIGINIFGVPLEEFLFWFGAAVFFPLLYLVFDEADMKLFGRKRNKRASVWICKGEIRHARRLRGLG